MINLKKIYKQHFKVKVIVTIHNYIIQQCKLVAIVYLRCTGYLHQYIYCSLGKVKIITFVKLIIVLKFKIIANAPLTKDYNCGWNYRVITLEDQEL